MSLGQMVQLRLGICGMLCSYRDIVGFPMMSLGQIRKLRLGISRTQGSYRDILGFPMMSLKEIEWDQRSSLWVHLGIFHDIPVDR